MHSAGSRQNATRCPRERTRPTESPGSVFAPPGASSNKVKAAMAEPMSGVPGWMGIPEPNYPQTVLAGKRLCRPHQTRCGESWSRNEHRLAHVPPHVPDLVRFDRSADRHAARANAACLHPDNDERLRTGGDVGCEASGKQQGSSDGPEAGAVHKSKKRNLRHGPAP